MPRKAAGLTARQVQTQRVPGLFADGGGLYLQVAPTGAKTWIFRFQIAGRRRDMGLGSATVFSLAEARQKAADARRLAAEGVDPIEHRAGQAAAGALVAAKPITFQACAAQYISSHRPAWRNPKHAGQWPATLARYPYPPLGHLPVQSPGVG